MSRAISPTTGRKRQWGGTWVKVRRLVLDRDAAYHDGRCVCEYCGSFEGEAVTDDAGTAVLVADKQTGEMVPRLVVMEVDHILAFSKGGGEMDLDNLISACQICNNRWNAHEKPDHIFRAVSKLAFDRNRAVSDGEEA